MSPIEYQWNNSASVFDNCRMAAQLADRAGCRVLVKRLRGGHEVLDSKRGAMERLFAELSMDYIADVDLARRAYQDAGEKKYFNTVAYVALNLQENVECLAGYASAMSGADIDEQRSAIQQRLRAAAGEGDTLNQVLDMWVESRHRVTAIIGKGPYATGWRMEEPGQEYSASGTRGHDAGSR